MVAKAIKLQCLDLNVEVWHMHNGSTPVQFLHSFTSFIYFHFISIHTLTRKKTKKKTNGLQRKIGGGENLCFLVPLKPLSQQNIHRPITVRGACVISHFMHHVGPPIAFRASASLLPFPISRTLIPAYVTVCNTTSFATDLLVFNMEPVSPFVQVVQYDLTSSSEDEQQFGSNLLFSSARLDSPALPRNLTATEEEESDEEKEVPAYHPNTSSASPAVKDEPRERILVSSDEHSAPDDALCSPAKAPRVEDSQPGAARLPCTKAYAVKLSQLPEKMGLFLKEVRSFFTKPHSLQRQGHFLAQSTYLKVEERVCCKYR